MYLGNHSITPQNPMLLTGQITIKLSPQNHQSHDRLQTQKKYSHDFYQPRQFPQQSSPPHKVQHLPSVNFGYQKCQQGDQILELDRRMKKIQDKLNQNIFKINDHTLDNFYLIKTQLLTKMKAHQEQFVEQIRKIKDAQDEWRLCNQRQYSKNKQQINEAQEKLEIYQQQLIKQMQLSLEKRNKQEKIQMFMEIQKYQIKTSEKLEIIQEKIFEIYKAKDKIQNNIEKQYKNVENSINLYIESETQKMKNMNEKMSEMYETVLPSLSRNLKKVIKQKRIQKCQQYIMKNSNKNFEIDGQSITLERKIHDYQQVLLGGGEKNECFTFHAEINQTEGKLIIGVVDQLAQKEKISSYNSGNAICCGGVSNRIWFVHNGKCQYRGTGVRLRSGMKVSVEVNLPRQTVTFTIKEGDETHEFKQQSDILKESHREFVPFLEMAHQGDSITWDID